MFNGSGKPLKVQSKMKIFTIYLIGIDLYCTFTTKKARLPSVRHQDIPPTALEQWENTSQAKYVRNVEVCSTAWVKNAKEP